MTPSLVLFCGLFRYPFSKFDLSMGCGMEYGKAKMRTCHVLSGTGAACVAEQRVDYRSGSDEVFAVGTSTGRKFADIAQYLIAIPSHMQVRSCLPKWNMHIMTIARFTIYMCPHHEARKRRGSRQEQHQVQFSSYTHTLYHGARLLRLSRYILCSCARERVQLGAFESILDG